MSILSTNTRLIKVGQDYSAGSGISIDDSVISVTGEFGKTYSAGDNISIYEQGEQLYISSKDWTNDIENASANAYSEAVSQIPDPFNPDYISAQVDNKLDTTAFTSWQNGQYSTDLQTIEGQISNKLDETAFSQVSGDFLTAAPADMATTSDVEELEQTISETYQVKGNYVTVEGVESSTSGKSDISATVYYESKPSSNPIYASGNGLNNVDSIRGMSNLAIVPSNVLQVPNVITAAPNAVLQVKDVITAATNGVLQVPNVITAAPNAVLEVPKVITANPGGIIANGLSAQKDYGLTANGITAGKQSPLCIQGISESISSVNGAGFTFSSQNKNFGTAQLTTANSNQFVKIPSPKFEARNISGAGFSIEASGAKGYDESGNVVWDTTKPAKLIGWSNYQGTAIDQRAAGINGGIIATVLPDAIPNTMSISSSPYTYMNGMGFYEQVPGTISSTFDDNGFIYQHIQSKITASMGYGDVKYEKYNNNTSSTDTWSLTGSVQKREIEYDADTSAITAIAGSAIAGGGGVTGEFLPQSAYNAITSYQQNSGTYLTDNDIVNKLDISAFTAWSAQEFENDYELSAGEGVRFYEDNELKITRIDVTGGVIPYSAEEAITSYQTNSGDYLMRTAHMPTIGRNLTGNGVFGLAVGSNSKSFDYGLAIGEWTNKNVKNARSNAAIGYSAHAYGTGSQAFGEQVVVSGGMAIGNYNKTSACSFVIGNGTSNTSRNDIFVINYDGSVSAAGKISANGVELGAGGVNQEVESYVQTNSGTIDEAVTSYQNNSGTYLTSHQSISANEWNDCYNNVNTNSGAWASALPTYEYDNTNKISAINGSAIAVQSTQEVSHDNTLSGNGTVDSPLGVMLSATNDANVNNIIVTASLPSTPDANTLYLIPEN